MADFWAQGPQQDFNLGGFAPAPPGNDPQLLPQQPGSDFGMKDPMKPIPVGAPSSGMGYSNQTGMLSGQPMTMRNVMGGVGNWMQGGSAFGGSQNPVAVQAVAHQMNPTMQGFGQSPQQPMNPGQQNQTLMQSPDGQHFQYVNQEHVPHYQGLGATLVNGSSYGGM